MLSLLHRCNFIVQLDLFCLHTHQSFGLLGDLLLHQFKVLLIELKRVSVITRVIGPYRQISDSRIGIYRFYISILGQTISAFSLRF